VTVATTEWPVDDALQAIAVDLHALISRLQPSEELDKSWRESLQQRCNELSERASALRERVEAGRQAARKALHQLGCSLKDTASELTDSSGGRRLSTMRQSLARSYEDFVHQIQDSAPTRPIRIPRICRSLFHVAMAMTAVTLYSLVLTRAQALFILTPIVAVSATLEITRRFSVRWNDFLVDRIFGLISRPSERYRTNSATWYLLATTLITFTMSQHAVCAALLVLGLADPAAGVVGFRWGRIRFRNGKSLIGCTVFLLTALVAVWMYLSLALPQISMGTTFGISMLIAAVGTVTELFSGRLDDNFTIPIVCALAAFPFF
jgi:dolichol kinase